MAVVFFAAFRCLHRQLWRVVTVAAFTVALVSDASRPKDPREKTVGVAADGSSATFSAQTASEAAFPAATSSVVQTATLPAQVAPRLLPTAAALVAPATPSLQVSQPTVAAVKNPAMSTMQVAAKPTTMAAALNSASSEKSVTKQENPTQISIDVNINLVNGAVAQAKQLASAGDDSAQTIQHNFMLLSVAQLQPARENLPEAFAAYDKNGDTHVSREETNLLRTHVALLVHQDHQRANELMHSADFRGGDGLDMVEFGALIDLISWDLHIEIGMNLSTGKHLDCTGGGTGNLLFGHSAANVQSGSARAHAELKLAHADLHTAFHCVDVNGDGKLNQQEMRELVHKLVKQLKLSDLDVARALTESDWGYDGYGEIQFDCLLMRLVDILNKALDKVVDLVPPVIESGAHAAAHENPSAENQGADLVPPEIERVAPAIQSAAAPETNADQQDDSGDAHVMHSLFGGQGAPQAPPAGQQDDSADGQGPHGQHHGHHEHHRHHRHQHDDSAAGST